MRERPDTDVLYVGTRYGFEAKWLPKTKYRYELYDVHGLLGGRGAMARMKSIAELAKAIVLARATLQRFARRPGRDRGRLCLGTDGTRGDFVADAARLDGAKHYTGFFEPDAVAFRQKNLCRLRSQRGAFQSRKSGGDRDSVALSAAG